MNEEFKETVKHILRINYSSFEHLAKQCKTHKERIENALKELDRLEKQERESTSTKLQIEALKRSALAIWRSNKNTLEDYFVDCEVPFESVAQAFAEAFEQYADMLICPYCKKQNVEVFNDDEIEQGVNRWRLQCQHCGLETPQLTDAEEVINIWDKFGKLFMEGKNE